MPIVGWACPHCHKSVPLDHYTNSPCGLLIHPDYAQAILDDRAEPHHTEGMVTVTAGLGCPRSRALENSDEDLIVNPLDYNALLAGQAWDRFITGEGKLILRGEIAGIQMAGEIDSVRYMPCQSCPKSINDGNLHEVIVCSVCEGRGYTDLFIEDWKHSNNNQQRFMKKEMAEGKAVKFEYRIQTSIYAELYAQMHDGERPTRGMVWNHYSGAESGYNSVLIPLLYDFVPLDEALGYKPYGGDYTVLELYKQVAQLYGEKPITWKGLPLAGVSMAFGTKDYCSYCQVRAACMEQATGAPF